MTTGPGPAFADCAVSVDDGEYTGSPGALQLQRSLHSRAAEIAAIPAMGCLGRTAMIIDDGSRSVEDYLALVDRELVLALILPNALGEALDEALAKLGHVATRNLVYVGDDRAMSMARETVAKTPPPSGLRLVRLEPDSPRAWVAQAQTLNNESGVVPCPGWMLRGEDGVSSTILALDEGDRVVGLGCATALPKMSDALADTAHLGSLSVAPVWRGKGLAGLLQAAIIAEAADQHGVRRLIEGVQDSNAASCRMIERSGLRLDQGRSMRLVLHSSIAALA